MTGLRDQAAGLRASGLRGISMTRFILAALVLAVMADRVIRGRGLYRTLLIWPYAVAPAVAGGGLRPRDGWSVQQRTPRESVSEGLGSRSRETSGLDRDRGPGTPVVANVARPDTHIVGAVAAPVAGHGDLGRDRVAAPRAAVAAGAGPAPPRAAASQIGLVDPGILSHSHGRGRRARPGSAG